MAGCTNCAAKSGCEDRKGSMFAELGQALEQLYPTRTWGEPDDLARFGAGVSEDDGQALAEELASELDASTFYRPGESEEYCDYIYVLCMGREPSVVQIRDGGVPVPAELAAELAAGSRGQGPGHVISEQYLRVCLSHMARMAGVQQVAMELSLAGDAYLIREVPRSGVYDAPLLHRFQRVVALLPAYDIVHLDFGEISAPPQGFDPGAYTSLYGGEPHTSNYLFYPQPSTMQITCLLDVSNR
jgi:hypothetical protein